MNRDELISLMGIPFSDEQLDAITAPMAPSVIIAGAGTGKTTVMAARVVWLVATGEVTPQRVLGLTFTRKAAGELSSRVRQALLTLGVDEEIGWPQISTYDGFASAVLHQYGPWIRVGRGSRIVTDAERYLLADEVLRHLETPPDHLTQMSWGTLVKAIPNLEERLRSHLVDDQDLLDYSRRFVEALDRVPPHSSGEAYVAVRTAREVALARMDLLMLCQRYRDSKRSRSLVEFSDQMAMAVELVDALPEVGKSLRMRYGLVVVDEYQDTSPAQTRLLSLLFGTRGGIDSYPITAVGDPLQAIYTWRGAAVNNIYSFHEEFRSIEQRTSTLTINRRSGPSILTAANHVSSVVRTDPLLNGAMAVELVPSDQAGEADVVLKEFETWDEEVDWIADSLALAHRRGDIDRWDEVAILVRQRKEMGPLHEACTRRGIPVVVQDLKGLMWVEAVSQVIAMMRLLTDPGANPEVVEVLMGPRFRVDIADMELLGRRARELAEQEANLLGAVMDPGETGFSTHALKAFFRLAEDLKVLEVSHESVLDQVRRILSRIGLDVEVHASMSESRGYLQQFMGVVAEFTAENPQASLRGFLGYVDAGQEYSSGFSKTSATSQDAVSIMTIHHAKGLEWEWVYLPAVVDRVFPNERLADNPVKTASALPTALRSDRSAMPQITQVTHKGLDAHGEDLKQALRMGEDRLAYVAMTRAKRRLVITAHRWRSDLIQPRAQSRYVSLVADLPCVDATLLTNQDRPHRTRRLEASAWPVADDPMWREGAEAVAHAMESIPTWECGDLPEEVTHEIAAWDDMILQLSDEASQALVVDVPLPAPLSASQFIRLLEDREAFASSLARPLPTPPSKPARVGSRFHDWVEQYYSDSTMVDDRATHPEIAHLCSNFLASQFASAHPRAVEEEFIAAISGFAISGRIDAVFMSQENPNLIPEGKRVLIVDWKTGSAHADPRQLAVYARAWAAKERIDVSEIAAGFFYVATSRFVEVEMGSTMGP